MAIYIHSKLKGKPLATTSHKKCEVVVVNIPVTRMVNILTYRPPKTQLEFSVKLKELE